jgi:site-specific DNA-methyltransferase (adenine-specific)
MSTIEKAEVRTFKGKHSEVTLYHADCLEAMSGMPDNSVDAVVTDPPYGLSFMGKKWDYDVPDVAIWKECLRVLKPGGHLLAFAGTRTQHRMAVRIEDVGFEIRDMIAWVYGSGFPKSHNLDGDMQGWGTALKPALEPITMARKPLIGTVAENVLEHGTGAINVDACRVGTETIQTNRYTPGRDMTSFHGSQAGNEYVSSSHAGRWPANLIHDGSDEVVGLFPDAPGQQRAVGPANGAKPSINAFGDFGPRSQFNPRGDSGSAARFFYTAKASRDDRSDGNHHPTVKPTDLMRYLCRLVTPPNGTVLDPFMGSGSTGKAAILEGFSFIGVEKDKGYFDIACERIERELAQGVLF